MALTAPFIRTGGFQLTGGSETNLWLVADANEKVAAAATRLGKSLA